MKNDEIKIGKVYLAEVIHREVPVRIDSVESHGGWSATNLSTGKSVRIKTAQRLRREVTKSELKNGEAPGMDNVLIRRSPRKPAAPRKAVSTKVAQSVVTQANVAKPEAKLSGLGAAYRVLCESDEPLATKQMIRLYMPQSHWRLPRYHCLIAIPFQRYV